MNDLESISKLAEAGVSKDVLEAWLIADTAQKMKDAEPMFVDESDPGFFGLAQTAVNLCLEVAAKKKGAAA